MARTAAIPAVLADPWGVLRAAAAAGLAGALAGIAVGGIGGRIAMRISGALSDPSLIGAARTANGNVVGEVTLGGTIALTFFSGLAGVVGGAAYAAARPWLAPLGRWGGVAFGLALLAAIGPVVLEPSNVDFRRFGTPALNVAMFALLFPVFGIAVAWILRLVERRLASAPLLSAWTAAAAFGLVALAFTLVLGTGAFVTALTGGTREGVPRGFLLLYFLVVPVIARLALERDRPLTDARHLTMPARLVTYALLLAPVVAGLPATLDAIRSLARP